MFNWPKRRRPYLHVISRELFWCQTKNMFPGPKRRSFFVVCILLIIINNGKEFVDVGINAILLKERKKGITIKVFNIHTHTKRGSRTSSHIGLNRRLNNNDTERRVNRAKNEYIRKNLEL